jgi:hypothetical protein
MQWAGVALAACLAGGSAHAAPVDVKGSPVDAAFLASVGITPTGTLAGARQVLDAGGRHVLVLTRTEGPSREMPDPGRKERIDLLATYYDELPSGWKQAWTIKDAVDIPGLDIDGRFLDKGVTVTDLDRNGAAEVTVSYTTFCGGGVDPGVLKVILRQGETKLALRGETELRLPGMAPDGGGYTPDKDLLLPGNAVFKRHLDKVWQQVKVVELY